LGDTPVIKEITVPLISEQQAYFISSQLFYNNELLDSAEYIFGDLDPKNPLKPTDLSGPTPKNIEEKNSFKGLLIVGLIVFVLLLVVFMKYKKIIFHNNKNNKKDYW
jgi:hypothetical protein